MTPDPLPSAADGLLACDGVLPAEVGAPPGAGTSERRWALLRLGLVATATTAALVFARVVTLPSIPLCAFKMWTGRPCPGCGMTRSVVHLALGDVAGSFRLHPLGLLVAAALAAGAYGAVQGLRTGEDPVWRWLGRRGGFAGLVVVVALLSVWVLRTFVVPEWAPDPIGPPMFASHAGR